MLFRAQAAAQAAHGYAGRPSDAGVHDYFATLHLNRNDNGAASDDDSMNSDVTEHRIQSMKFVLIKDNLHIGGKRNSSRVSRVIDPTTLQDVYNRSSSFAHSQQKGCQAQRRSSVEIIAEKTKDSSKVILAQCRHLCLLICISCQSMLHKDNRAELFQGLTACYHRHNTFFNRLLKIFWVFFYYIVGILFFVHEERDNNEPWTPLSAVYFITQTVSTVGYGNLVPSTDSGRIFVVFYALVGILLVFSIVNEITYALFISSLKKIKKVKQKKKKLKIVVRKTVEVILWFILLFALIFVGSTVIYTNEMDYGTFSSYDEAFYFSAITATGIGYGDFALQRDSSIVFNIFYILVSVSLVATAMEKAATLSMRIEQAEVEQELDHLQLTSSLLENIKFYVDKDKVSKSDYILFMLLYAGLIDHNRDIEPWIDRFDEVDEDNDGVIDEDDVRLFTAAQLRRRMAGGGRGSAQAVKRRNTTMMVMEILHEVGDTLLDLSRLKRAVSAANEANSDAALDKELHEQIARAAEADELATMSPIAFRARSVYASDLIGALLPDGSGSAAESSEADSSAVNRGPPARAMSAPEQQLAGVEQIQASRQIKMSLIKRPSLVPKESSTLKIEAITSLEVMEEVESGREDDSDKSQSRAHGGSMRTVRFLENPSLEPPLGSEDRRVEPESEVTPEGGAEIGLGLRLDVMLLDAQTILNEGPQGLGGERSMSTAGEVVGSGAGEISTRAL